MLRIALVEDEKQYRREISGLLEQFSKDHDTEFEITEYGDGETLVENYKGQFELILLDIEMEFMDGMTAAKKLREVDEQVMIVFITNNSSFAIAGYEVKAFDYIMKPLTYPVFEMKMLRITESFRGDHEYHVKINLHNGVQKVPSSRIYYIESLGHIMRYSTRDGDIEATGKLSDLEEVLTEHGFFRISRGFLVNMAKIDLVKDGSCLINGEEISISRRKKTEFMQAFSEYL